MKAHVYVSLKKTVLDPQGKTIHGALKKMGYQGVSDLRQGKYFEIALDDALGREAAQAEVERIAPISSLASFFFGSPPSRTASAHAADGVTARMATMSRAAGTATAASGHPCGRLIAQASTATSPPTASASPSTFECTRLFSPRPDM